MSPQAPVVPATPRRTATERRADVLAVALAAFANHGYAASTRTISARAGISEPYLFRLFETKRALFEACALETRTRALRVLAGAAGDGPPTIRLRRMVAAYAHELAPVDRRFQVHLHATPDVRTRDVARVGLLALRDALGRLSGAGPDAVQTACAHLLLLNITEALDLELETNL